MTTLKMAAKETRRFSLVDHFLFLTTFLLE